jgi:hypothetical protein
LRTAPHHTASASDQQQHSSPQQEQPYRALVLHGIIPHVHVGLGAFVDWGNADTGGTLGAAAAAAAAAG